MGSSRLKAVTFLLVSLLLVSGSGFAQTWNEFFRQKKTQEKYLLEQIGALKVYAGYLKKGYDIASQGIHTVSDIKNGEFGLHSAFFSSLKAVSPMVRDNAKVAEIIAFQLEISKAFHGLISSAWLSTSNLDYISLVKNEVMEDCKKDLEELLLVITSGKVEMTDDQRIRRLDKVYANMQDKSAFTQNFCNQVSLLIRQKETETQSLNRLKAYYGITD